MTAIAPEIRLETGSLVLATLAPEHLDPMWEAITESAAALRGTMPWWRDEQTKDDIATWTAYARSAWQSGDLYAFSILSGRDGRYLGACSLEGVNKKVLTANLSYWVRTSSTRRGIASSSARRLAAWACSALDLQRVEISMVSTNLGSIAAARKSGAVYEGRLRNKVRWSGESRDMMVFSFTPQDLANMINEAG